MSAAGWIAVVGVALALGATVGVVIASRLSRPAGRRLRRLLGVGPPTLPRTDYVLDSAVLERPTARERSERRTPVPPPELVDACIARECVLVAGTGLGRPLGLPTWREALLGVLQLCERTDPDPIWRRLQRELGEQQYELVADFLRVKLGPARMRELLREVVGAPHAAGVRRLRRIHRGLLSVPFAGVVSSGWDETVAELFSDREAVELDPESTDEFARVLRSERFFVLHAYGSLRDDTLLLTTEALQAHLDDHPAYARFLGSIHATRTLLFAGAGVAGIEDFLRACGLRGLSNRRHFALAPWSAEAELHRERLAARYGVELLLYDAADDHRQMAEFGDALASAISRRQRRPDTAVRRDAGVLTGVRLANVGPFEQLELDLGEDWTVLLGDNGCGKSSVLRAIALALSGDDDRAMRAAGRLLNSEAASGEIELTFDGATVSTRLVRERSRVRVVCGQYAPVQAGACLALGFPPLRGVSLREMKEPASAAPVGPGVEDLLPLVTGSVDPRLDDLRQWIALSLVDEVGGRWSDPGWTGAPERGVVARFFAAVSALLPQDGFTIAFERVDPQTREVLVRTPDGVVPLQMLSQGMSSTLAWMGTVLARMDEVRRSGVRTDGLPTIVLVDEIDAHLHPRWQREIVGAVCGQLPGVQVVATTHSPLVVGSVGNARLWHLERREHGVDAIRVDHDYRGWRADQILTAPPFGTSSRDTGTEALLDTYERLAGRDELAPEDRARLERAAHELDIRLPAAPERAEARKARELIEHAARERIEAIPADERERVLRELRLQVQEAIARSGRRT